MEFQIRSAGGKSYNAPVYRALIPALILILLLLASPVSATGDQDKSMVTVVSYTTDPEVMMKGDEGTIKVTIKNNAENPVHINRVCLYSDQIPVILG